MNTSITNQLEISRTPEYDKAFWNAMRIKNYTPSHLTGDINSNTDAYFLPASDRKAFADKLKEESLPRRIGSILNVYDKGGYLCERYRRYGKMGTRIWFHSHLRRNSRL